MANRWFAWFPVKTVAGKWRWLRYVLAYKCYALHWMGHGYNYTHTEYRDIENV